MLVTSDSPHRERSKNRTRGLSLSVLVVTLLLLVVPMPESKASAQSPVHLHRNSAYKRRKVVQGLNASSQSPMQKGISFTAWWAGQYREPGADLSLEFLASTGANWIALIVTAHQDTYTSTTIDFTDVSTPTDEDLIHVIAKARSFGLKVMLKPHLDLRNETATGYWRGDIGSGFTTEAQWSAWFASYRNFIEHYALLAQNYGVDQFCVGTELLGTTHRAGDWRAVVAGVRAIYDGPITYAALKNGEETSITWWDAVDYIGVDGYYKLYNDPSRHPTVEELEAGWEGPKTILANLSATYGKPIILTEIGYRSHHGCSSHPWDSLIVSPIDLEEQACAYEAAFRQLYNEPWLAGFFWWQWLADPFESGPCDDGYSPHLKPAEDVLRAWYGGAPRPPQPFLVADYDQVMDIYTDGLASGWQDWSWEANHTFNATDQAFSGTKSIAVTLGPWGALSLWRPAFSSGQYHWLEFYVRGSSSSQPNLSVFFDSEDGTKLIHVPVNDCHHIEGGTIDVGTWKPVRIPLSYLNAPGLPLVRLTIQDKSGQGSTLFWIDDLRLVGAKEPVFSSWVYLPLVVRNN